MSEMQPIRQAAEVDFLDALECLSGTFSDLETTHSVSVDLSQALIPEESVGETGEPGAGDGEEMESRPPTLRPETSGAEAIAEGYDNQAVGDSIGNHTAD